MRNRVTDKKMVFNMFVLLIKLKKKIMLHIGKKKPVRVRNIFSVFQMFLLLNAPKMVIDFRRVVVATCRTSGR